MPNENRIYYISDQAYGGLVGMAQRAGFVKYGSNRVLGLSTFLNKLAVIPLNDTRPPLVKQRHSEEERNGRAPTWVNVRARRGRMLSMSEDAIARYFARAFEFGIIRTEPFAVGGPDRTKPYPSVGFVLEGLGLGWITPIQLPSV